MLFLDVRPTNANSMKLELMNEKVVVTGVTELVAANSFALAWY